MKTLVWTASASGRMQTVQELRDNLAMATIIANQFGYWDDPLLAQDHSALDAGMVYVTAYTIDRRYGGPEEGGWWYDWYEVVESVKVYPDQAETTTEALRAKHQDLAHGDRFSVLGGVALAVYTEDTPGELATHHRPHYE